MIRTASPRALAWNPMLAMPLTKSSTDTFLPWCSLKSIPMTSLESAGKRSDGFKTASATVCGTWFDAFSTPFPTADAITK
jgi:hypothetical protein